MKVQNGLSLESSFLRRSVFGLTKIISSPRSSFSWVLRGHLAKDEVIVNQTYWFNGKLPRVPLAKILPGVAEVDVLVLRAFDRKNGTSISLDEACHLGTIAKSIGARRALEIGTYDGNTALLLAANLPADAEVVTVDLPPDFGMQKQDSLTYPRVELNLTQRDDLGRQYRGHRLSARIRQVYGDSAALNWSTLGGPFDLVFIDGCHSEEYVRSDSQNAVNNLAPGGVILWHDYGMSPAVSREVDRFAARTTSMKMYALEGTRLAIGLRSPLVAHGFNTKGQSQYRGAQGSCEL